MTRTLPKAFTIFITALSPIVSLGSQTTNATANCAAPYSQFLVLGRQDWRQRATDERLAQEVIALWRSLPDDHGELVDVRMYTSLEPSPSPNVMVVPAKWRDVSRETIVANRLVELVRRSGWPTLSQLGAKANRAAFSIAQRATPEQQRELLTAMHRTAASDALTRPHVALFEDCVALVAGQEQPNGTLFWTNPATRRKELWPLQNSAAVDKLRHQAGLIPLEDQLRLVGLDASAKR